jgi:hypothetical protein
MRVDPFKQHRSPDCKPQYLHAVNLADLLSHARPLPQHCALSGQRHNKKDAPRRHLHVAYVCRISPPPRFEDPWIMYQQRMSSAHIKHDSPVLTQDTDAPKEYKLSRCMSLQSYAIFLLAVSTKASP